MTTKDSEELNSRDGNSSSNQDNQGAESPKKKRMRVGDLRKQSFASTAEANSRGENPYKDNQDNSDYSDRPRSSSYNNDRPRPSYNREGGNDRRPYNSGSDRSGGYNNRGGQNDNRGGYSNDRSGGGYSNNRSGGYNDNRGGGYNNDRGGYNNNRGGGSYSNNRSGGYNDNRGGGYSDRGNNQNRGGYNNDRGGYNNNRGGGGYSNNRSGGYSDNRGGGQRGGYSRNNSFSDRGGYSDGGEKRLVKPVKYKENVDPNTPLRLNKYLANAGVCSRREADAFITSGVVRVNGEVVDQLGAKVTRADVVTFQDQAVRLESKVYVLLNKPKNCVTTSDDPQNRMTVMDLVKNACPERIYPVGRLDRNTTGVLLLTNDGDLASKLTHPKFMKKKIYQVTLDRDVAIEDMQSIADGIELDDGEIHADSIAYQSEDALNVVGIEIHSGRNRVVRRIFEKLSYQVVKLDRVYFAGLTKKNVPRGKWRYLTATEVNMLRMGAFE